jgi:uncharacterized membrane protein YfcA
MQEVILFLVGIIVGAMNAIAGGGMLIGFPVLLASGMGALSASATSPLIVLPGQMSSAYGYRDYLRKVPKRYLLLGIPCFAGGLVGATILSHTSSDSFEKIVPGLVFLAVILFAFQPFLHRQIRKHLHGPKKYRNHIRPLVDIGLATFPLSIYGGYFGPGFGFVMLALLGFTKLHQIHQINAMKNIMAVFIASAAVIALSGSHLIDWHQGIAMAIGNTVGGYGGARTAQRFSTHALRVTVIVVGVATAGYLAFRSY